MEAENIATSGIERESMTVWLRRNLIEVFQLPIQAVDWLCTLFDTIQTLDDLYDCDRLVTKDELKTLIWSSLIALPNNPFFRANQDALWPLVATSILKWQGANEKEENGTANAVSFVWRAGFYDIVLMVVGIVHGHKFASDHADKVMNLYGEKIEEYLKEFDHA